MQFEVASKVEYSITFGCVQTRAVANQKVEMKINGMLVVA
jgi:hypothetical protein